MGLTDLTRDDATDSAYVVTERNIEIATAYALRSAKKWKRRIPHWMDEERFDEAVILAVMRSAKNYKSEFKTSFFTYARSMVHGALLEEDRYQRRKYNPTVSIEELQHRNWHQGDDPLCRLEDRIKDPGNESPYENIDARDWVQDMLRRVAPNVLPQRSIDVIVLRYIRGMKQKDVAKHLGITPGRVHQIEDEALGKLHEAIEADPELSAAFASGDDPDA